MMIMLVTLAITLSGLLNGVVSRPANAGIGFYESQITSNSASQEKPDIYGNIIVYQDNRNGNWDIYMYDLSIQTESQITNNPFSQEYPAIDGSRIVWQDSRNTNFDSGLVTWDIYMYDLLTQTEKRLSASGLNTQPAISGNRIAYIKNGDVYYYDLSTVNKVG